MGFNIDKDSTVSIYQQLADQITRKVQEGELSAGVKLPTVRELADQTGIARGTVKHAYEELERKGIIQMTRGKGTFVQDQIRQHVSTKSQAMDAIDRFLDEMEALSFSPQEIQTFFQLKLRERMETDDSVCIIFIDCNPETLANIIDQVSVIPNIEVQKLLLSDAVKNPFLIDEFADLIVTTSTHMGQVSSMIGNKEKLVQVVTAPSSATVAKMAMIGGRPAGILCASEEYARIIRKGMRNLELSCEDTQTYLFGSSQDLEFFLQQKEVLIVPNDFLLFCSRMESEMIQRSALQGKTLIRYNYQIDGGSLLNVRERVEAIRTAKYI